MQPPQQPPPPPGYPYPPPSPGAYGQPPWPPYQPPPTPPRPFLSKASRPVKVLLGVGSILPLVGYVLFFIFFATRFITLFANISSARNQAEFENLTASFQRFYTLNWILALLLYGLLVLFIVDVFRTERVPQDRRVLWLIVLLVGGFIAMPVYWYLNVWREPPPPAPPMPPPTWYPPPPHL